jgi:hypothetical protein
MKPHILSQGIESTVSEAGNDRIIFSIRANRPDVIQALAFDPALFDLEAIRLAICWSGDSAATKGVSDHENKDYSFSSNAVHRR